jgi:hypothetical protein
MTGHAISATRTACAVELAPPGPTLTSASAASAMAKRDNACAIMPTHPIDRSRGKISMDDGLWIILLESLLALAMLIFIVWWTMPRKKREPDDIAKREN